MEAALFETNCSVCSRIFTFNRDGENSSSENKLRKAKQFSHHLWTYLYHQNVRESIALSKHSDHQSSQLTFTMCVGGGEGSSASFKESEMCEECWDELEKLDKLHQELEAVKKKLTFQVGILNGRLLGQENLLSEMRPPFQMSFAGSVKGQKNIGQTLNFLGSLCNGISYSPTEQRTEQGPAAFTKCFDSEPVDHVIELKTENIGNDQVNLFWNPDMDTHQEQTSGVTNYDSLPADGGPVIVVAEPLALNFDVKMEPDPLEISADDQLSYHNQVPESEAVTNITILSNSRKHKKMKTVSCNVCGKIIARNDISSHIRRVHIGEPFPNPSRPSVPCAVCGKMIMKYNMRLHMRVHTGEKSFECDLCHRKFVSSQSCSRHRLTHTGERPHSCEICNKRFSRLTGLRDHKKNKHGIAA